MESEYLSGLFRRCCLALVGSHTGPECKYEKQALEQMVIMAEDYITDLLSQLQRLTAVQRRQTPSLEDVAILFNFNKINILDLVKEAQDLPQLEASVPVAALNALQFDPELAELSSAEKVFFESSNSLAPTIRHKPAGFEPWMPSLPPDHTYLQTPSHSSEIRNLWQVRQRLVQEGKLAEEALQRLMGDNSASFVEVTDPRLRKALVPQEPIQPISNERPINNIPLPQQQLSNTQQSQPQAPVIQQDQINNEFTAVPSNQEQPHNIEYDPIAAVKSEIADSIPETSANSPTSNQPETPTQMPEPMQTDQTDQSQQIAQPSEVAETEQTQANDQSGNTDANALPASSNDDQQPAQQPVQQPAQQPLDSQTSKPEPEHKSFKLKLSFKPKQEPTDKPAPIEPAVQPAQPPVQPPSGPKIALKLSLGKPKKKKHDFLGKRPRYDIEALAHGERPPTPPVEKVNSTEPSSEMNVFDAAIASLNK